MRGVARKSQGNWSVRSIVKSKDTPTLDVIEEYYFMEEDQKLLNRKISDKSYAEVEYYVKEEKKDNVLYKYAVVNSILN